MGAQQMKGFNYLIVYNAAPGTWTHTVHYKGV